MAIFEIKNLTFTYPMMSAPALENINLTIQPGDFVLITGPSGSGKSTLLSHLKPAVTPHGRRQGQIFFDGQELETLPYTRQSRQIGYVFQDPSRQIVSDKVWREMAFGPENLGMDRDKMARLIAESANFFGIEDWFERDISTLSGGQKQLLNLAAVMVCQPQVLVLDEPTSQLDPIAASEFLNALSRLNSETGTTVIMTEQRTEQVFALADRVIFMQDGKIAAQCTPGETGREKIIPTEFLPTPTAVFRMLEQSGRAPVTVKQGRNWLKDFADKNSFSSTCLPEKQHFTNQTAAIEAKNLFFRYGKNGKDILSDCSISIPKGCILSVIGGNGSGKSTLLKVLAGASKAYYGKIKLDDKSRCALLPQEASLLFSFDSVMQELQDMTDDETAIDQAVRLCRIDRLTDRNPYDLSAGQRQRTALAKVMLCGADILLLDEVTAGMDGIFKKELGGILRRLTAMGKTIVLVSHDIEFCAEHSDLVAMMFNGQLTKGYSPREFFSANNFYTTAAARMTRGILHGVVSVKDVTDLCKENLV